MLEERMDVDEFCAGLRVLAVDDDRVSLLLVEKQLQRCKYNVTTVMHAEMALEILRARRDDADQFDLVITDVHMPEMDGFKLLEVIGLEMDIPVIMLSANDTLGAMMKGIQHGACDYFAKPARLEQLKTLWMHVVRNKMNDPSNRISKSDDDDDDDDGQKLQSRDGEAENGANQKFFKKRKDGCGTKEDKENTSTSKRRRFEWSVALHRKFVEVVNRIGMDKAVPKTILEMMNVEGLRREHVASHLQKFRLYLKKLASGTSSRHGLFTDEVVLNERNSINITGQEHFEHNLENGRYYHPSISFAGFSSSSNPFGRLNSSAAFGTHNLLPTQSLELMTQRSLGITLNNMGPVGYGSNMSRVALPGSQQDLRNFTSCGISNTSMCFPSGPSGSSFANVSNGMPSNSFANIPNASSPLGASMERLLYPFKSYARQCMADGELPPPSNNLPMKQPLESAAPFNGLSGFPKSGKTVAISKFLDLGSEGKTTEVDSFEGNSHTINRLSRFAASSSGQKSEFQNQMAALTKKTTMPMACYNEQVAPFNIGSSTSSTMIKNHRSAPGGASSTVSTFPNLQMNKPVMWSEMLNGEGVIVDQQAVGDELNNNNGFLATTSTAQNGTNDSFDDFFGDWINQDVLKNGDAFMDGDWEFTP